MMRTTLLIGLCCALAAPASANGRHAEIEFGQFCRSTTSLVPCTLDHMPRIPNSLTGYNAGFSIEFPQTDHRHSWTPPATIQLVENSEESKDLGTLLQEYINSLLGKKPAAKPKPEAKEPAPKPAEAKPAASEPTAAKAEAATAPAKEPAPTTIAQPPKADIDKALAELLTERGSWGTAPAGSTNSESSASSASSASSGTSGNPSLATAEATGDLGKFFALRESWGSSQAKPVEAPLAKGAPKRLDLGASRQAPAGPTAPVIVNEANLPPEPELSLVSQADIVRARNALFEERTSWGTAPATSSATVTGDLQAYFERRDRWGKGPEPKVVKAPLAKGAQSSFALASAGAAPAQTESVPTTNGADSPPSVSNVSSDISSAALKELFATRESWGAEPNVSTRLVAGDLDAFFARRDGWGKGPKAKVVNAPLAKGASKKLRLSKAQPQPTGGPEVIINALEERPLPQVADIAPDSIKSAMKDLLAERGGWGAAPDMSGPRFAGDLDRYFARRDGWGKGRKAKVVKAPLAKGASKKLRLSKVRPQPTGGPDVIINALEERPLPQVGNIATDTIKSAMKDLLAERGGWGTTPSASEARVAGDLTAFLARRDRWGAGPKPSTVKAPLAKGAKRKLKLAANRKPSTDTTPVIVNELEALPLPQVGDIAPDTIKSAMNDLLAEREGWGSEPAISGPRFAGDLKRYFARRDGWGKGPEAKAVKAPLAKGARRKLRLAKVKAPAKGKPPIINELEDRPLPQVSAIPADQIGSAMTALIAEREGWGTTPSMSGLASASSSASAASTGDLAGYLAQRDLWQNGTASASGTQVAAVTPSDAERTRCSGDLNALANKRTILFANGSSDLNSSSNKVLDEIAATIRQCGDISVRVEGHTDSTGGAKRNQQLSEARAKSVADYLVGAGLKRSKLTAVGYGETKPVASNSSSKSRALNRRIEFTIE